MDKEKMKELMIDYIDGRLTGELSTFVEKHIKKSEANLKEYESLKKTMALLNHDQELQPDSDLKSRFLQEVEELDERAEAKTITLKRSHVWQVAAAVALLAVGVIAGFWLTRSSDQEQMLAIQREVESTKRMVMMALNSENSASERMMGVNASYQLSKEDDEITNVLIKTMNEDENINVRLAAINALAKFSDDERVRQALVSALDHQQDPLVQITLINLMVTMKEKAALDELKNIIQDSTAIESVKDEAHMAVFKLS